LWFPELGASKIGRITTAGVVTEYPVPTANSGPYGIAVGPDGTLWFTEENGDKVGDVISSSSPAISSGGVVNAAGFAPSPAPVAPGSIVSIFGSALATATTQTSTVPLPSTVSGTQVLMNGLAAPLFFVSPGQINAQIPWEMAAYSSMGVQVLSSSGESKTASANLAQSAPGVFTTSGGAGVVVHASNSTLVSTSSPAVPGEYLTLYGSGLGPVNNPPASGGAAPGSPLSQCLSQPTVMMGGVSAAVSFCGLTPGLVGLYQVNLQVPTGVATGSAVTVSVATTVTIAVEPSQPANPSPVITSLTPSTATVGSAAMAVTINGSGFLTSSTASFNGVSHAVKFLSATQLSITVSTSDLSTPGSFPVAVTNPAPGGGTSNVVSFAVTATSAFPQGQLFEIDGTLNLNGASLNLDINGVPNNGSYLLSVEDLLGRLQLIISAPASASGSSVVFNGSATGEYYNPPAVAIPVSISAATFTFNFTSFSTGSAVTGTLVMSTSGGTLTGTFTGSVTAVL
jgi:uncharacterized protein (TIGR03437 family)